jgi:hypothetical protein
LKKGIVVSLLFLCNQTFAFQYANESAALSVEMLIWQLREVGDENWGQILGPTGTNQQIQFLEAPFKWDPGFRLGASYLSKEKSLDVSLYYTWYKARATNQVSVAAGEFIRHF